MDFKRLTPKFLPIAAGSFMGSVLVQVTQMSQDNTNYCKLFTKTDKRTLSDSAVALSLSLSPVSYTHLDVYKRQTVNLPALRTL